MFEQTIFLVAILFNLKCIIKWKQNRFTIQFNQKRTWYIWIPEW